jgi:hypothetical protein
VGGAKVEYLWCRVEESGDEVSRVIVMHPNGEILFSYPPEHFEPRLVRAIQAGQVRARLSDSAQDGLQILALLNGSGVVVSSEEVPRRSITEPRDAADR